MSEPVIYLDNNATSRVADEVVEAMRPYLTDRYGNASSMHRFGGAMRRVIDQARQSAARLLGCEPDEIVFTSGGTESDNAAIRGIVKLAPEKRHIITTRVEHPAVRTTCRQLQREGYRLTELAVDRQGRLDLEELRQVLGDDTVLVSVMTANNETGVIFPIAQIAELVRSRGAILHTDAVQAAGKVPLNLSQMPVDLASVSGHKFHAPKGVGILYVRRGTALAPLLVGGHQELGKRAGTENVAGIAALGAACKLALDHLPDQQRRVKPLRDRLEAGLLRDCLDARVNGDREHRVPNTTNISFEYVEGEAILLLLDRLGICASSGSACTSGSLEPSHVLRAMGVPFTAVHGSIRFSLSRYTTDREVDTVIREMPAVIRRLREISMFHPERDATAAAPTERTIRLGPRSS
ncbi:MAG: cysteine desulfurase NifS [Sedimentisphaerales bacterium]|nr:cysteine desulfurase NifS [Sedimentisphaerales bacterium]